ncbi:hypothetical protein FACS1894122_15490 [Alphaproteobacteria bacterium]|nr:hypothetical protein FACS1894122_15490 [Alphaproteobacteria bacterium]
MNRQLENKMEDWKSLIPEAVSKKYEVYNFNHALEILSQAYKQEFNEIIDALENFSLLKVDIMSGGGNESAVPKKMSALLHPKDWSGVEITGNLIVYLHSRNKSEPATERVIENFIDGHIIDYVKGKIAIDMEWNSKDQAFDRDLYAFRAFYECDIIACGIIITRSEALNGGCPLLVLGITPQVIEDLGEN